MKPKTRSLTSGYQALQGVQVGPHQLNIPGRYEAGALTDCCPRTSCLNYTKPAAVLDWVEHDRITGRVATYRCRMCDAAWLCWWAPPGQLPVPHDRCPCTTISATETEKRP